MKKPLLVLLGLALVVAAVVGLSVRPASAHNTSAEGLWSCSYTRPPSFPNMTIDHSVPVALGSGWVEFWCHGTYYGGHYRYMWRAVLEVDTGFVWRSSPYTDCNADVYCQEPG